MSSRSWRVAAKIAWRESRASFGKFAFVVLAVAAGVGAVSGVRGFSSAFRDMLLRDARQLMAADLSVRLFHEPDARETAALEAPAAAGAERTWITETVSMMGAVGDSRPLMVTVKAVDPTVYPFYGEVGLRPNRPLAEVLDADTVVATEDLLVRLGREVGDRVRLGDAEFAVGAALLVEPDRMTGGLNVGPRLMLSRAALARTGLIGPGSRAAQRWLYKMPAEGLTIERARRELEAVFPRHRVADFRETHPTIRRGLDRATNFLSLVSLVAMIVGALGVGMAMHSHLQQRLDSIAIMKCVGARSNQIVAIYALQALGLGLTGSLIGVALGFGVQAWAPRLIAEYFPQAPELSWSPEVALQALAIGLLTTLLFSLPPLLGIRRIRPALIFRREMEGRARSLASRLRDSPASLIAYAAILVGLGVTAAWLGDSLELGAWFAGGLLFSLLALSATAWALLRFLRSLPRRLPFRPPTALRHGLANLHRPGTHSEAVLAALGVGVTFTLSVYLIQHSVVAQMVRSAPPDMPNVFLVNVTSAEKDALSAWLKTYPNVESEVELTPSVSARILAVDGVELDQMKLGREGDRFRRTRGVAYFGEQPEEVELLRGRWWAPAEPDALSGVREDAAESLGLNLGSEIEWMVGADRLTTRVANIYRVETIRPTSSSDFIFTPSALEGRPAVYYGGLRIAPEQALELQREAFAKFPTVLVVSVAEALKVIQQVVDQIALVVEFVSAFSILGGVVILSSSVVATRFRRVRETAILKTLGAKRAQAARIFTTEFLVLGGVAGAMGGLLASGFSALLLERFLDAQYDFEPVPVLTAAAATALLAVAAGRLATFRILDRRPLEVLRDE